MSHYLLDANVLIALTVVEHEHHERAATWLPTVDRFAVCPVVEGALVRFLVRIGESTRTASEILSGVWAHPRCEFWPDDLSYRDVDLTVVRGHRQVTDTYLVGLARGHDGMLATFDSALVAAHPRSSVLIG
ncbi:PIN domain-containing protein [Ornithinimicrobium ciconiae]|uniref:Ribonuclease VapC n=1 Tax=Ornithinimicrobium ciconiae TaxID=2594265 RepID=A0A516G7B7_9MICO|nr:TA system VapC family ribonuclease toxin [Ornithinimicrobium ciconiae]QDO87424.1 PIN domain-containing protein [Ornithinimicrobium ciconiae]